MKNRWLRAALSSLLALFLLLPCLPAARAEEHGDQIPVSIRDRKGIAPAEGTWIDREGHTDGECYTDVPNTVHTLRIGLCYGSGAVEEAWFENSSGLGFRIGVYDEARSFYTLAETDVSVLQISWAELAEDGLQILGGDELEPVYFSGDLPAIAIEPIGGETYFEDDCFRGGFECRKYGDWLMTVVNVVGLEDYVKGVIPYEMANNWPVEALKAQAVCARTYGVYNLNAYADYGFDLTDDTECQVYRGTSYANARTDDAVEQTAGQFVRYRGEICEIYYSSADGGATEDGSVVFGSPRPYLLGKRDPFEHAEDYDFRGWSVQRDGEELRDRLAARGYQMDTIKELHTESSAQGNVVAVTFTDMKDRTLRLEGRACYTALGLPSCHFHAYTDEEGFHFDGSGLGHNCGMSQWGARAMDEIYGYSYEDIIRFYFTGAYVA